MYKKKKNNSRFRNQYGVWFAFVFGGVFPVTGSATSWEYGVIVDLGVVRTDNVLLANDGLEESDTVYTIAPKFYLRKDSDRLDADILYRPEAFFYSDFDGADDVFHVLDASLTGTLVKDRFFVYLSAVNFQSIVTREGNFPTSNLPISGNRVDSSVFAVRPYWRQRIGEIDLYLEAAYRSAEYDDEQFQSSDETSGRFSLSNVERQQGLAWGIDYNYRRMEYEISPPWEFQRAALNLGVWINGSVRIFAVGGTETAFDNIYESDLDADFWEAGFQYKPSERLNFELAAGDRSYGNSFRGSFSYTLRRGDISVTYNEGPSTRAEQAFGRRPITDTDNLDSILDQPGLSDRFVRRRGELATQIELSRSELTLRIFFERRELRTTADGIPLENEELSGAAVRWSWNIGTKTTFGISADISERIYLDRKDDLRRGQIDLAFKFGQRTSIRLEAKRSTQYSKELNSFDYDENQVRLLLRTEF